MTIDDNGVVFFKFLKPVICEHTILAVWYINSVIYQHNIANIKLIFLNIFSDEKILCSAKSLGKEKMNTLLLWYT
jgi:hypothetical protein